MKLRFYILMVLMGICSNVANSKTIYNTFHNNFNSLLVQDESTIKNNRLCIENKSNAPLLLLDTTRIISSEYKYTIRIANNHNKAGKSYPTNDGSKITKHSTTTCGLIFNCENVLNYYAVIISALNTDFGDDLRDKRVLNVEAIHVVDGNPQIIESKILNKDINLQDGLNSISVEVSNSAVNVKIGNKSLNFLFNFGITQNTTSKQVGCYIGEGANVQIERTVLSYNTEVQEPVTTKWTKSSLDAHFAESKNPFEGYWTYLDRDMKDDVLRIGGRYTIALVGTDEGYDIIYVDGAQVKKSLWKTGMLKGRLINTIFTDNFNGQWIDATFRNIGQDIYGTFESGVILNIKFPVYNSQIRFSKVL